MAVDRLGRPLRDDPYRGNVRVYAASNITLSGLQTIDGVTLESGDRVLVQGQSTTSQNGIYVAKTGIWTRARDLSTSDDFKGPIYVTVEEGTTYRNTFWYMLPTATITVDTDAISFTAGTVDVTSASGLVSAVGASLPAVISPSVTSLTLSSGDVLNVLNRLDTISAVSSVDLNLPAGVLTKSTGSDPLINVGPANSNIRLLGASPISTTLTSVASVSGSSGDYAVVYNVASGTGIEVGHVLCIEDAVPLPHLSGNNSVSRLRVALNEMLYKSALLGTASITSGGSTVVFASVSSGVLSDYFAAGYLVTVPASGQSLEVTSLSAPVTLNVNGTWNRTVSGTRACVVSRRNTGTISTAGSSTTVTGASTLFTTQGNVGDILIADGRIVTITAIASATSMTVSPAINLGAGTPYSIITPACAHEGAHEVTAVSGTQITVRNRWQGPFAPPVNRVSGGAVRVIRTVLKSTNSGDGIFFRQGGRLGWCNNIAIQSNYGSTGTHGIALNGRTTEGPTELGTVADFQAGDGFAVLGWGRGAFVGIGCSMQLRRSFVSGNNSFGVWAMEGADVGLRETSITGNGGYGVYLNAGSKALITEMRASGNLTDGLVALDGAVVYGELPFAWGNSGMNFRVTNPGGWHVNEGVSIGAGLSGIYALYGTLDLTRWICAGNARENIEAPDCGKIILTQAWVTGGRASGGSGHGVTAAGGYIKADSAGIYGNAGTDIVATLGCFVDASNSVLDEVSVDTGAQIYVQGVTPTVTGVRHINGISAEGSRVFNDSDPWTSYTVTVAPSAGSITTYTATGRYREIDGEIEFEADVTVTTNGTGSGLLNVSLPLTSAGNIALSGANVSTGVGLMAYTSSGNAAVFTAAGAYPVVSGDRIILRGRYRAS